MGKSKPCIVVSPYSKQPYTTSQPYTYSGARIHVLSSIVHILIFSYSPSYTSKDYISQSGHLSRWISHVSIRIVPDQTEYIRIQPQKVQLGTKDATPPSMMNSEPDPLPPQNDPPSDPPRARKRRRRTMACTQCRSRKLRCDREYPICGRCQKSKTPAQCIYEDGFLWQQPNTVPATTVFSGSAVGGEGGGGGTTTSTNTTTSNTAPGPASTVPPEANITKNASSATNPASLPRVADRTPVQTPDSGITAWAGGPPRPSHASGPECMGVGGKRDRFLETVLGAPKAAVNQEPYVNTDVLQRHGASSGHSHNHHHRSPNHNHHGQYNQYNHYPYNDQDTQDELGMASPSQQLDLSPRIMMRGKETRTRFNGSGILANVMAQVSRFSLFLACRGVADNTVFGYQIFRRGYSGVQPTHGPAPAGPGASEERPVEKTTTEHALSRPRYDVVDHVAATTSCGR